MRPSEFVRSAPAAHPTCVRCACAPARPGLALGAGALCLDCHAELLGLAELDVALAVLKARYDQLAAYRTAVSARLAFAAACKVRHTCTAPGCAYWSYVYGDVVSHADLEHCNTPAHSATSHARRPASRPATKSTSGKEAFL